MPDFYDWQKTFSFDADVTMVTGARGIGKTFGLRAQFIRDWKKDRSRFVEIVRYKNELFDVADGYFDRISELEENDGYIFKTDSRYAYIAVDPKDDKIKPEWHKIGYFFAMTQQAGKKKKTFHKVRRLVLDEAIIERTDRYHDYLPNEFEILAKIIDTASRERKDVDGIRPRVYLLSNACNFSNPYFARYNVHSNVDFGYHWYNNKTFLWHYVDPESYAEEKAKGTVAGRMLAGTASGLVDASNKFIDISDDFILRKPKNAKFAFGIYFNGEHYGVWIDYINGYYHINKNIPNNSDNIYYLSNDDAKVNYLAARRTSKLFSSFSEAYYMGILRYEDNETKNGFSEILRFFGVR